MIKVSVIYPNKQGAKFDTSYYFAKHMPLVARKLGAAVKTTCVDQGVAGPAPGSPPAFVMMAHFTFESIGDFQAAFVRLVAEQFHTGQLREERRRGAASASRRERR